MHIQDIHGSAVSSRLTRAFKPRPALRRFLFWGCALWLTIGCVDANAEFNLSERRKDQFPASPAHLVVPLPYSYPGIGEGVFLMGNFSNIFQTTTDFLAMYVAGDAGGYILQADEVPLIDRRLYLRLYYQDINKAQVNQYDTRGMEGSGKDGFSLLDISLALEQTANLNLTFYDRRLNFHLNHTDNEYKIDAIRDHNGNLITKLAEPYRGKESSTRLGVALDLTDDYLDPRTGLRFGMDYQNQPARKSIDPDFYVLSYSGSLYLPLFDTDTLVFNYYQSDAHVTRRGNTDPTAIRGELGLNCGATDTACLASEQKLVDVIINQRANGTAASLGGKDRLRSYPQGRFQGGHSAFFGVEYRLNFKDEVKPFNYFFWKDVRTGLQVALFAEAGSVSETAGQLWRESRYTYGAGLRLVAASGAVYRADLATGNEGSELTVFFAYPW
ncbi:MAG: BamA/TamA family outer membrane protein [Betaproteobacteria bacterium]|nr:BamA/TamA family outer membrane protein [Betaproteobacteria bacterium]